jgi:hypothetical protein
MDRSIDPKEYVLPKIIPVTATNIVKEFFSQSSHPVVRSVGSALSQFRTFVREQVESYVATSTGPAQTTASPLHQL